MEEELKNLARLALLLPAGILLAQGPPPGGFGGGPGFGPMGGGGFGRGHMEKAVTGAPYSATLTEQHQQTLPDGNQISTETSTKVYRDSQGRVRRELTRTLRNGQTRTFITIFDPVASFEARLDPEKLTAVKRTLPPQNGAALNRPRHNAEEGGGHQVTTVDLGTKTIEGLAATGKQITMTVPAGEMGNSEPINTVREVWTSTALKVPVLVTITNPEFGTSKMQLTAVTQSEPDPSLFQIPSNYTVSTAASHFRPAAPAE
jgi:hypothetical protein